MDLSTLAPQTRDIQIRNPANGEATGLVIRLLPMSSPKVKAAQNRMTNERLVKRSHKVTAESIEENGTKLIVSAVDGWEWQDDASFNGAKPEFTEANLRAVLKIDWIRKQLDEELGDEASFFRT